MRGGKIAGCDGAPAGCADSGKTDYSRNSLSCADGAARRALLALVSRQTHFSLISRVLKQIEMKYTENLNVEQLAAEANMSVSAFHHNFKAVTSTSPLQYLKSYRLHKARMMMIHDGMKASAAACGSAMRAHRSLAGSLNVILALRQAKMRQECGQCKGAKWGIPPRVNEA